MKKSFRLLWSKFLDELPDENISSIELVNILMQLLCKCSQDLEEEPFLAYGLNQLAKLRAEDYPVEFASSTEAEVTQLLVVLRRSKHSPVSHIAQLLRDALEQLLVVESDKNCPRCASGGMGIFKNRSDGRFALQCKHCGLGAYFDGSLVRTGEITLATTSDLKGANLIQSREHPAQG